MKRLVSGVKDENGQYVKTSSSTFKSVDELLEDGLVNIQRIMEMISARTASRELDREVVTSLKDCILLLMDLKKREAEILATLSEEQLEALVKK